MYMYTIIISQVAISCGYEVIMLGNLWSNTCIWGNYEKIQGLNINGAFLRLENQ
jgi:hypothetical protein